MLCRQEAFQPLEKFIPVDPYPEASFITQLAEVCLMETPGLLADPPPHIPALMTMQKQQLRQPRSTRTRSSPPLPEQR